MNEKNGFISIIVLLVMSIIVIYAFYLLSTLEIDYLMVNATLNSIQAYYASESKVYLLLNKDDYYNDQLLPIIKRYIKYGWIGSGYDTKFIIDKEDLIDGDNKNIIKFDFPVGNDRRILELTVDSNIKNINKRLIAELYIINEIFEMGLPIITYNTLNQDKRDEFINYIEYLEKEIDISELDDGVEGILIEDYDKINISRNENSLQIEYYRNDLVDPIYEEMILRDEIFLLVKNRRHNNVNVNIENSYDKVYMEGIMYVEGDFNIYEDFDFKGIIIVKGRLVIYPEADVNINGIILTGTDIKILGDQDQLVVNYDFSEIKKYGIYLPRFIDIKVNKIKSN